MRALRSTLALPVPADRSVLACSLAEESFLTTLWNCCLIVPYSPELWKCSRLLLKSCWCSPPPPQDETEKKDEKEKKKEPEPNFQLLDNPARVMPAQLKVLTMTESCRYQPFKPVSVTFLVHVLDRVFPALGLCVRTQKFCVYMRMPLTAGASL